MARIENVVTRYNEYLSKILPGFGTYDPTDKQLIYDNIIHYMLSRTQRIFKWNNLPDTIPQRILEMYLQVNGNCVFMPHENDLYIYTGGLGGEPDEYYQPTIYTIANPAQGISVNAEIGKDCVLMRNDSLMTGIFPLCQRYAYNMMETEISLYVANINSRIVSLISAQDDRTEKSATQYIENIIQGKLGVVGEAKFFDDLKATPFSNSNAHAIITDLIELMQYNKASFFNEIGLNANYNMKRESINSNESQLNNDALTPLIDDMLYNRQTQIKEVNAKYGTNITVEFASSWEENEKETKAELNNLEKGDNNNVKDIRVD